MKQRKATQYVVVCRKKKYTPLQMYSIIITVHLYLFFKRMCVAIKKIIIKMEVYAEDWDNPNNLHGENQRFYTKEEQMKELNVNLKDITYYLIQLFYKTGKEYSCTQTKLGKILSILAFRYALNGQKLFKEIIYKYHPQCGTLIKDLTFVPKTIYTRELVLQNPDRVSVIRDIFDENTSIPYPYNEVDSLPLSIEEDIINAFRHFGSYPADELGRLLNPIVDKIVDVTGDKIMLEKLSTIKEHDFESGNKNAIVEFIYQQ